MSENENKAVTEAKKENKVVAFFKTAWAKIKAIPWTQPLKPVVAWSVFGGVVALSVVLMLIFWL